MKLYSLKDHKAEAFGNIICAESRGVAERGLADVVREGRGQVCQYPEDFTLYELGEYDPASGKVTPHATPVFVVETTAIVSAVKAAAQKKAVEPEVVS